MPDSANFTGTARNLRKGDRVVVPSRAAVVRIAAPATTSQCDPANPNGPAAGTAFYGGPKESGPFDGMQAEYVRVPYAHVNLVKLPENVTDDQAILLSDIFPPATWPPTLRRSWTATSAGLKSKKARVAAGLFPVIASE